MRTTTRVHTPEERRQMRLQGSRLARVCQVQLWCAVSMARTVVTEVLPLCGSAGWWVAPLCMMPGLAVYGLMAAVMRWKKQPTLLEGIRAATGKAGIWIVSALLGLLLLLDGAATMTALVTIFTEGIGTEGTQITMALLTLAALMGCMHQDGLAWGIWLIRRVLLGLSVAIAMMLLNMMRPDGIHPVMGQGSAAVAAAFKASMSLGWPLILLLTVEDDGRGRCLHPIPPVSVVVCVGVLLCLTYPCEVLVRTGGLAERMLLGAMHLQPALRTLVHALEMLVLLLGLASAVQLSAGQWLVPSGRELGWLPYAMAALLTATQGKDIHVLWEGLNFLLRWLPVLLGMGLLAAMIALGRRTCSE